MLARLVLIAAATALAGCGGLRSPQLPSMPRLGLGEQARYADPLLWEATGFQQWRAVDPAVRFFPGDSIEVTVHTAPELSRTATIGPDGRVNLPLGGSVIVAGMTGPEAANVIADAYVAMLRDPIIEVTPAAWGPQNIIVGGEVNAPGLYEMTTRIGALEAVLLAGGFRNSGARGQVVILRRAPDGGVMLRTVDLRAALRGDGRGDPIPLRRHDIVFVPRTTIAEVTAFVEQYVYGVIPLDNAFSYAIANRLTN